MSKILGVSAFYHDSAAALMADGVVVAAAQEERPTREKHDHNFPFCLRLAGTRAKDLDHEVFALYPGADGRVDREENRPIAKASRVPVLGRWFTNLSPQGARRSYPVYNDMIRGLAAELGLPLAEPSRRVPANSEFLTDWCHFTAKGEELMAQIWFETLEQSGWFRSASGGTQP